MTKREDIVKYVNAQRIKLKAHINRKDDKKC